MSLKDAIFYGILDTGYVPDSQVEAKCRALVVGGAGIVQLRAKKESTDARRRLLVRILPILEGTDVPLIINDDVDLALEFPDCGLHIGQDDMDIREARRILGAGRIIGLSTHSIPQAEAAMALAAGLIDYFAVGPVFPTQTKPDYVPVGLRLVTHVASRAPALPWFAIGGINRANVAQVKAAGARRIVAVSDVLLDPDTAGAVGAFLR